MIALTMQRTPILLTMCLAVLGLSFAAHAQRALLSVCIEEGMLEQIPGALNERSIAPGEAQSLVNQIISAAGISRDVTVISCTHANKAHVLRLSEKRGDKYTGEFIVYNPIWFREVAGADRIQAIGILGHELGHIINGDMDEYHSLDNREAETRADQYAGCAVAHMNGDWDSVENLFTRLRNEQDLMYPNRLTSLTALRAGFDECRRQSSNILIAAWGVVLLVFMLAFSLLGIRTRRKKTQARVRVVDAIVTEPVHDDDE